MPKPKQTPAAAQVLEAIEGYYAVIAAKRNVRQYIGASGVGSKCNASLALSLRGFPDDVIKARSIRIFELGDIIEERLERAIKSAFAVEEPPKGKQHRWEEYGGHHVAHADGIVRIGERRLLLEIKSMSLEHFREFKARGIKHSHPHYYGQVMDMMALSEADSDPLDGALIVAECKNDSNLHTEEVVPDIFEKAHLKHKIVLAMENRAERISEDRSGFACRFCFKKDSCWNPPSDIKPACNLCAHAQPDPENGGWFCNFHDRPADKPCAEFTLYRPLPKTT